MRWLYCTSLVAMLCAMSSVSGCGGGAASSSSQPGKVEPSTDAVVDEAIRLVPEAMFRQQGDVTLGAPLAVSVDFGGIAFVADASPARIVAWDAEKTQVVEFNQPPTPGFYPTDLSVRGFFVYVIDERGRTLLRFDNVGTFRDVLLNFETLTDSRRVSPYSIAVQETGRLAVTDIENHQVLVLNNYVRLEVAFGNYGSFEGQFDTPRGISFTPDGNLLVADTGNARLQLFSDGGTYLRQIPPPGVESPLHKPVRAVAAPDGRMYVADQTAGRIFVFTPSGMPAGSFMPEGATRFEPTDVELTTDGRLFVTDTAAQLLYVFKGM